MAELVRVTRSKSVVDRLGNNDTRVGYSQQYYQRNKDKKAAMAALREPFLQNNGKRAEYLNRNHEWILDSKRQAVLRKKRKVSEEENVDNRTKEEKLRYYSRRYYLENNERKEDYRTRHGEMKLLYRRQYHIQNKEKVAESQQEYYRKDGGSVAEKRRIGKKESMSAYFGYQRSWRSWKVPEMVREFLDSIGSRLNILNYVDWYRISRKQMALYGGLSLYEKFGSLGAVLQHAYPEIKWNLGAFSQRGKKSGQRWLKLKINELLPGADIVEEYQHPDLNWVADSDQNMELDLWIPQHRIGIEYQGEQHYFNIDGLGPSSAAGAYSERDRLKNNLCESRGITLISIPYWWDGSSDSLSATLYQARPDVFPVSFGRPIPRGMPVLSRWNSAQQLADSYELKYIE